MARLTAQEKKIEELQNNEEVLMNKIAELEAQVKSKDELCQAQEKRIIRLEELHDAKNDCIQDLKETMQDFLSPDQSKMTIEFGRNLLIETFNKIKCHATRRESFKQFVANILHSANEETAEAKKRAKFSENISSDLKEWTAKAAYGEVVVP